MESDKFHEDGIRFLMIVMALLENRLPYLRGRGPRMDEACKSFADALRLPPDEQRLLSLAARFHDIGLLAIPDAILNKPGRLTDSEYARLMTHTDLGGRLIDNLFPLLPSLAEVVWWHHERPDGKGPYGLKHGEIPLVASIIHVVQAVEAMINLRPHKDPSTLQEAVAELERCRGTQFEPEIVDIFRLHAEAIHKTLLRHEAPTVASKAPMVERVGQPATVLAAAPSGGSRSARAAPTSTFVPTPAAQPEDMEPIITKEELLRLVNEGLKLRPLAATVQRLMSITSSAQCTADDVADAIGSDQALSIRLLKLASSTVYSRGHAVENVKEAVQRMGIKEVRNTVTTLAVMHNYQGRIADYIDPWLFWEHSIACGVVATLVAKACHPTGKADYFLLGMLHEVGRLILIDHIPDKYAQVWEAADATEQRLEIVEKKLLMLNHSEILESALEHWHFPQELIVPVVNHHQSVANLKRLGPVYSHDAAVIALADRIAHAMLLGSSGNDMVYPLEDVADLLGLAEETMGTLQAEGPKQTVAVKVNLLARGNLDAWPDFRSQLKTKLSCPIRPLCVSARPRLDAYKIFCELLVESGSDEPPNVGVIYASDVRELDSLITTYTASEQKAGAEQIPIVIVKGKGKFNPDHAWLKSRNIVVLDAPTSMKTLINAFNRLLA